MTKITLEVKKFNWQTGNYQPHRKEIIDETTAEKLIEICDKKIPVEGFYQYGFIHNNQLLLIYTLNADLVGFIEKPKQER